MGEDYLESPAKFIKGILAAFVVFSGLYFSCIRTGYGDLGRKKGRDGNTFCRSSNNMNKNRELRDYFPE